jgi:predicted esterase
MSEKTLQTDLHVTAEIKLYYDLHIPEDSPGRQPLLISVHGYGAHKRYMMREARLVANENFVIASLEGPHQHFRPAKDGGYRTGFGWLTDQRSEESVALHHEFVLDVIDRLSADEVIDPERVYLFGFSQACALNFRFAFTHPDVLAALVGVCGGVPGDLETNPKYKPFDAKTFYLYSDDDEFYKPEQFRSFDEKLKERLPNYTSREYKAKHEITDEMRRDIKNFLHRRPV